MTQWKQYLTTMQIAQFLVILAAAAFASECRSVEVPRLVDMCHLDRLSICCV